MQGPGVSPPNIGGRFKGEERYWICFGEWIGTGIACMGVGQSQCLSEKGTTRKVQKWSRISDGRRIACSATLTVSFALKGILAGGAALLHSLARVCALHMTSVKQSVFQ